MSAHPGKTCVGYVWGDYKGCEVQLFPVSNEGNNPVPFHPVKRGISLVHFQRESRGEKGMESCAAVILVVVAVVI